MARTEDQFECTFFLHHRCSQSPHGWRLAYVWQPSACSCVLRGLRNDLAHKNDGHKLVWSLIFPTGFWPAAAALEPFGCYGRRRWWVRFYSSSQWPREERIWIIMAVNNILSNLHAVCLLQSSWWGRKLCLIRQIYREKII